MYKKLHQNIFSFTIHGPFHVQTNELFKDAVLYLIKFRLCDDKY